MAPAPRRWLMVAVASLCLVLMLPAVWDEPLILPDDSAPAVVSSDPPLSPSPSTTLTDDSILRSPTSQDVNAKPDGALDAGMTSPRVVPAVIAAEFGARFGMAVMENDEKFFRSFPLYGRWPLSCDSCQMDCLKKGSTMVHAKVAMSADKVEIEIDEAARSGKAIQEWGLLALDKLVRESLYSWEKDGIRLDHHVSMVCCSYKTRMHYNPTGFWAHIYRNKVTLLRLMVDGYERHKRVLQMLRDIVESGEPFLKPIVLYVSTTDTPCNPSLPYFTFFTRRGVRGIVVPDDTFYTKPGWEATKGNLTELARRKPFRQRKSQVFFRGSPTHYWREQLQKTAKLPCCSRNSNISLAVLERFKHLVVPLAEHTDFQFVAAVRGRTASNRDKYLTLLNSTILRVEELEPWFQFYHPLFRPWLNYVPVDPTNMNCTYQMLFSNTSSEEARESVLSAAEGVAAKGFEVGQFLSLELVAGYWRKVLRRYADAQRYDVHKDPVEFLRGFHSFTKRRYPTAQVMPDDRSPMKFVFYKWISRRMKQMMRCRQEAKWEAKYPSNTSASAPTLSPATPGHHCWY